MLSSSEWKERLAPLLPVSLRDVSDAITNQSDVQDWLHEASFKAADGLAQMPGMQAEAEGYMRMMDDLEATFPALFEAVADLTDGCAAVDLHWRPLTPSFSRIYLSFDLEIDPTVFCRLQGAHPDDAQDVIKTVSNALPKGDPFPNRPQKASGVVSVGGAAFGLRVLRYASGDAGETYRTVTLFPPKGGPVEGLSLNDAARHISQAVQPRSS